MDKDPKTGRFLPGHTAATKGRKKRKSVILMDAIGKDRCNQLMEKIVSQALDGCVNSQKILADKLWASCKSNPVKFQLPQVENTADMPLLSAALLQSVAAGDLPPDVGAQLSKLILAHVKSVELHCQQQEIDELKKEILIK